MNNEHRDDLEELKLADETLRALEGGICETDQDNRTLELGRLLSRVLRMICRRRTMAYVRCC